MRSDAPAHEAALPKCCQNEGLTTKLCGSGAEMNMGTTPPIDQNNKLAFGSLSAAAACSVSVAKLKPLIEDSEAWAKEYIKREKRNRARGANREAAHFEDLVCAHQNFAGSLRKLVWAAEKRKPTPNDQSSATTPSKT
jgi:hypothetical protein